MGATERGRTFCETSLDEIRALPTTAEMGVLRDRITEVEKQRQVDIDDLEVRIEGMVQQLRRGLLGENSGEVLVA